MSDHAPLYDGLRAIYTLLVALNYLSPTHILDPHTAPDAHAAAISNYVLTELSFDPMAINVIHNLPLISDEASQDLSPNDLIQIRPDESPFSFSLDAGVNVEVFNAVKRRIGSANGNAESEMPRWVFPITKFPVDTVGGLWHFYDAKTCSIVAFDESQDGPDDKYPYSTLLQQNTTTFFETWYTNIQTLTWLPWTYKSSHQHIAEIHARQDLDILQFQYDMNGDAEMNDLMTFEFSTNALSPLNSAKNRNNQYWCRRGIYEASGWPGRLDLVEFERRKEEWQAREVPALSRWRSMKWDAPMGTGWSALVRQGAGERGVDI